MLGTFYILWSKTGKSNNWAGEAGRPFFERGQYSPRHGFIKQDRERSRSFRLGVTMSDGSVRDLKMYNFRKGDVVPPPAESVWPANQCKKLQFLRSF